MPLTGTRDCQEGVATKRRRSIRKAICLLAGLALTAIIPMTTRADDRQGRDDEETFTCTVQVVAGQSIQAAIDGAPTGATVCVGPGTYQENLLIAKDGITLKGAGPGITVLEPPAQPRSVCLKLFFPPIDYENNGLNGICVAERRCRRSCAWGSERRARDGLHDTGLPGVGIVFADTNRPRADHNVAANNRGYGITAFDSTHGRFEYNTSLRQPRRRLLRGRLARGRLHDPRQHRFCRPLGDSRAGLGQGPRDGQPAARQLRGSGIPEHGHDFRRAQLAGLPQHRRG